MESKKAIFWLKLSFLVGMITDALALIPMLLPPLAKIFWGFNDFTGIYYFAMGYGASLMLAGQYFYIGRTVSLRKEDMWLCLLA